MADDDDDLVVVYSTDSRGEIALIRMWLDEAGIPYIGGDEVMPFVYPVDGMALVRFLVRRSDAQEAAQILLSHGLK